MKVKIDFTGKQQRLEIKIIGCEQNAQRPKNNRYVLSFQQARPFNSSHIPVTGLFSL